MTSDAAKTKLLEAALSVFLRYGFRKTSMDEVARAAHISRQGLYLHFSSKEELFRATVKHLLSSGLEAACVSLHDGSVRCRSAWPGRSTRWSGVLSACSGPMRQT